MTEYQPKNDTSNHAGRQAGVLQNTRDPLPWLIQNLRQKNEEEVAQKLSQDLNSSDPTEPQAERESHS